MQRISVFLKRETRDGTFVSPSETSDSEQDLCTSTSMGPPLALTNASFRVGLSLSDNSSSSEFDDDSKGTSFTVRKFDFSVEKGEVLAVCGPVGSGKTSLINGIIDEVPAASSGTLVSTRGRVTYVSQSPFILNCTLRENILFGLPFEQGVYDTVLDACCLRPDLEQLGEAKDLTEIGERGVTLSGGKYHAGFESQPTLESMKHD